MPQDIISINNSIVYILYGLLIILFAIYEIRNYSLRNRKYVMFVLTFVYILIFSFRSYIGYDWINYLYFYDRVPLFTDPGFWDSFGELPYEYGFNLYTTLLKNIFNDYGFFTFINSVINIILINVFIRRYSNLYALSFLIFYVMGGLIYEIDFMRNMKSILLFMLSIKYIEEKRFLPFMLLNSVGVLFHSSSLIYIPLYFIFNRRFSLVFFWILFLIGNIIFLFQIPFLKHVIPPIAQIIGGRIAFLATLYFEINEDSFYGITIGYVERIFTAILITIFYSRLVALKSFNLIFINCILYYLIIFFYFGELRMVTLRVPYLFFFSYSILLPQIYQLMRFKVNRQLFILMIILYSVLKIHGLTNALIYNYDNILFDPRTKEERTYDIDRAFMYLDN